MAIPDYQSLMLPLLQASERRDSLTLKESADLMAKKFSISDDERRQLLPSGNGLLFNSRVSWARTYLKKAGLLEEFKPGALKITERGHKVLKENPERIDVKYMCRFEDFKEFYKKKNKKADEKGLPSNIPSIQETASETPEELLEVAYENLKTSLAAEVLEELRKVEPAQFEKIVVDVLVKMGYGGSRADAGNAIGKSGDEGIDGIIKEDKLGLDIIYIQAKRWMTVVGRPEIQKFAGALLGQKARKGVFITTSGFTKEAIEYASKIDAKIILIDGETLAELMVEHNIGVQIAKVFEVKNLDTDYFSNEF